jgi:hypothetical protein
VWSETVRLAELLLPKNPAREFARPKRGELRMPTGGPGLTWLMALLASRPKLRV